MADDNLAEVIQFPTQARKPSCFICQHAIAGANGTYCMIFEEVLLTETVAEDCEQYEEDEDAF